MVKKENKNLTIKSFIPAIGLTGLGLTARHADNQINILDNKLNSWDKNLSTLREATKDREITFAEADEIIDKYTRGGSETARTKFLGTRSGGYLEKYYQGKQFIDKILLNSGIKAIPDNKFIERGHTIQHYSLFKNPTTSPEDLKVHMIEKALGDRSMNGEGRNLSAATQKILKDINTYPTLEAQYSAIHEVSPSEATIFRKAILGKDFHTIGEARRLVGNTRDVLSTPEVYKMHLSPFINSLKSTLPKVSKGSLIAGAVLGTGLAGAQLFKKASEQEDNKKRAIGTLGIIAGVPLTTVGAAKVLNPVKDVAVTYGAMPIVGMGHKSPGQAIIKLLKDDSRFKDINIDALERNEYSIFKGSPKKYALGINTGLGGLNADWADATSTQRTHGMSSPPFRATKTLSYQTDYLDDSGFGSGSTLYRRGSKVLGYGDDIKNKLKKRGFKPLVVSERYSPALDPDAVKEIAAQDDSNVFDKIIQHEKNNISSNKTSDLSVRSQESLDSLTKNRHKKFITVSGASRGDYVAIRAKELAEALDKAGLSNEYTVVAQLARARGSKQENLLNHPNIVKTGFLPRRLHNELQAKSVINWSNTGASTVGENMLMKNIQAYPDTWGSHNNGNSITIIPNSIADRQDKALGESIAHVNIDEWNKGTKTFLKTQKGVLIANSAEDIINTLKDPSKLSSLHAQATMRSAESFKEHTEAAQRMVDIIHREYLNARRISRIKGLIPTIIGAGILAGSGKLMYDSYKKKELNI